MEKLSKRQFDFQPFNRQQAVPKNVDLFWDPRAFGGAFPYRKLNSIQQPLVVTVHDLDMFSMKLTDLYDNGKDKINARKELLKRRYGWKMMQPKVSRIIAVSDFTKSEVVQQLNFNPKSIETIWMSYDSQTFFKGIRNIAINNGRPYFFTIINYQKKKNFELMVESYSRIPDSDQKPDFIAVVKPFDKQLDVKGLKIINHNLVVEELVSYYQNAMAFVYPTLHEGFGVPILEAMACGCAVITSKDTACAEIGGDAVVTVDPRSIGGVKKAMMDMMDMEFRNELKRKMPDQLAKFDWNNSALAHGKVFESLIK